MKEVYFDNASTTKVSPEVKEALIQSLEESYANPSSYHKLGFESEKRLRASAEEISGRLKINYENLYFTANGTQSNNIAILGTYEARKRTHNRYITTAIEHPAVLESFKALEEKGAEVIYLSPDEEGKLNLNDLENALTEDTALVSIMHVNNEIGSINNINEIGKLIKKKTNAYFHVDGVQGFGKIPLSLENVDMLSVSGHKIHSMKGVGALYVNHKVRLKPIIFGGGQQKGLVSGTENLNSIIALAEGTKEAFEKMDENYAYVLKIKNSLLEIKNSLQDVYVNGSLENASPYILNLSFLNVKAEVLLHALAEDGIYVSSGSACASNSKESKNVIAKLGYGKERHSSAVRFSFSKYNTLEEAEYCKEAICKHVNMLRRYVKK